MAHPLGVEGPQQAGRAHLPAEGRAGLSFGEVGSDLGWATATALVPGLEGPTGPRTSL